ncbi:[FeFe] hydrogenase, group A [[Eubacterium] hominis]|uniref:[FeFe] hydrogenase, group A n=1 Tax=[Eubacterium] hominis TaxID=2764325 RepID=UPI003A4E11C1
MSKHLNMDIRVPIEKDNPAILRVESLCIQCGQCKEICQKQISVSHHYDLLKTQDTAICIHCGQCANVCPTHAIRERQDFMKVKEDQQRGKKTVFITSPSVRVALGEAFGLPAGSYVESKMVGALRALGADYVFDTTFAADLTIMEEANELIKRIQKKQPLPQFTSCCPAWVKFVETYYPRYIPNLSTSKSPISMFASTIKTWFANKEHLDPKDISIVAITPCSAKKFEIQREEFHDASDFNHTESYQDCDHVVTTRELAHWMDAENLDIDTVEDSDYDSLMPRGSGAGIIFGNTGGVMEAAIRSAYYFLTGEQPTKDLLQFKALRGMDGIREATLTIQDIPLRVAVVHGTNNARQFISHMENTKTHYDFVEVMTCRGGCIGGGGQPIHPGVDQDEIRQQRIDALYDKDAHVTLRNSHDNPQIQLVYQEFYKEPLSEIAEKLLHTSYHIRTDLNEDPSKYEFTEVETTNLTKETEGITYQCTICGYIYEGDLMKEPDSYVCPVCFVPKEMFKKREEPKTEEVQKEVLQYRCTICGFIYEGDLTLEPDSYVCPICGVPKALFERKE